MSMLAEPRRKQKYSIDPRGLAWSNDDSKFGQKLMEKMGWQKGKGLGAQENGRLEHVAVSVKQDTRGVGCSKSQADNWIAHQDDFNSLLSQLNDFQTSEIQLQSLEKKAKETRARVNYQKFIKGKDLSNAKQSDLASIFGKRKDDSAKSVPHSQSEASSEDKAELSDSNDSKTDKAFGITTVCNGTSITDYFAQKMAEMKARVMESTNAEAIGETTMECSDKHGSDDAVQSVENCSVQLETEQSSDVNKFSVDKDSKPDQNGESDRKHKKKSSKHESFPPEIDNISEDCEKCHKKKKRKKNKHSSASEEIACDLEVADEDVETTHRKRSRKNRHSSSSPEDVNELSAINTDGTSDRQKKKKKKHNSLSSLPVEKINMDAAIRDEQKVKKCKKRKHDKSSSLLDVTGDADEQDERNCEKGDRELVDESVCNVNDSSCTEDGNKRVKKRKKKKTSHHEDDKTAEHEHEKNHIRDGSASSGRKTRQNAEKKYDCADKEQAVNVQQEEMGNTETLLDNTEEFEEAKHGKGRSKKKQKTKCIPEKAISKVITELFPGSNLYSIQGYGISR